jgi:hypothetical protein
MVAVPPPVDAAIVTVALRVAVPPAPVQMMVYVVVELTAPVTLAPLVAREPVQPPEAAHEVALVEVQVKVELPPRATLLGPALKETAGVVGTVTVTDWDAEPPDPAQVSI